MAARLTVIVSQAAVGSSTGSDLEESLVAHLLMTQGLDATLVGPLERIEPESTDYLCISGFNHNLAVVSWLDINSVADQWQRLGLGGSVQQLGQVREPSTGRTIYHIPLSTDTQIDHITGQLNALLKDRSVKTVGIALPLAKPSRVSALPVHVSVEPDSTQAKADESESRGDMASKSKAAARRIEPKDLDKDDLSEDEWASLEQLVDDFDSLDL